MKKYILLMPVVLGLIVLGSIGWWHTARSKPLDQSLSQKSSIERLNDRAGAATDDDVVSIDRLGTALIASLIPVDLPEEVRAGIHNRLVAAELNYRRGHEGVSEGSVVRTVNDLGKEFSLPEYAKTSMSQVRFLRTSMMGVFPNLLVPQRIHPNKLKESSMRPLSPMGAMLLTALLIQQKLLNEEFQIEPKDWRDHLQKKNVEVWRTYREKNGAGAPLNGSRLTSRPQGAKSKELRQLIEQRMATMTQTDLVNLTSAMLDQLGIPR